jgi:hypothetical protein
VGEAYIVEAVRTAGGRRRGDQGLHLTDESMPSIMVLKCHYETRQLSLLRLRVATVMGARQCELTEPTLIGFSTTIAMPAVSNRI